MVRHTGFCANGTNSSAYISKAGEYPLPIRSGDQPPRRCALLRQWLDLDATADSGSTPCGHVGILVADQSAPGEVQTEIPLRVQDHAGCRLAALTLASIIANALDGMMGTIVDGIQRRAILPEYHAHPVHVFEELLLGVIPTTDASLIGDDHQQTIGLLCSAAQPKDTVNEFRSLGRANIATIDVDHPVAIEEQCLAPTHQVCPDADGTNCCAR